MTTRITVSALGALSMVLGACGETDTVAETDDSMSVEEPADEALSSVTDEPVEDENVEALEEVEAPPAVSEADAAKAADSAEEVMKEAEEALAGLEDLPAEVEEAVEDIDQIDE